jgi:hypothetical protein
MPMPIARSGPPRAQPSPNQQRSQAPTERVGPLGAVPCPWCNHKNDFRALAGQGLGGVGEGDIGLETGSVFGCDKCRRGMKITRLEQVTIAAVAPVNLRPRK